MNDRTRNLLFISFLALVLISVGAGLHLIHHFLGAVAFGSILATITYPFYEKLIRVRIKPHGSALIVILLLIIAAAGPLTFIIIRAIKEANELIATLNQNPQLSLKSVLVQIENYDPIQWLIGNPEQVEAKVREYAGSAVKLLSAGALAQLGNLPDLLVLSVMTLLVCYFSLLDGKKFMAWMAHRLPFDREIKHRLSHDLAGSSVAVVWATLAAGLSQSIIIAITFFALDVPGLILAAAATFVFSWIPMVGSSPVWISGAIYLYIQGLPVKVVLMIVLGLFTGIVDNIVRPLVLRGRGEMHPMISLLAILGGIQLIGILGVFIGPIVASFIRTVLDQWPSVAERCATPLPDRDKQIMGSEWNETH